jgi:GH15 family glucan-1,4-alpha-glucosidase
MPEPRERGYRPIRDYAVIGGTHTAALVASDGSIDWMCLPHFDGGAVFCRILDAARGGFLQVAPPGASEVTRRYLDESCVLETVFRTAGGEASVVDFMPVREGQSLRPERAPDHRLFRLVEGVAGEVEIDVLFRPTFAFAEPGGTRIDADECGVVAWGRSGEWLACSSPAPLGLITPGDPPTWGGRFRVRAGERRWLVAEYGAGDRPRACALLGVDAEEALARTLSFWHRWAGRCRYRGPYRDLVLRSALTLKLLTYEPTGSIVAAPTTSLPEEVGGGRNWDYRFTWLRDSALTLHTLEQLGYREEAHDYFEWLAKLDLTLLGKVQILYTIEGAPEATEFDLLRLDGYRSSRPVRIGNAAAEQMQLDVFGLVLDAACLYCERLGPIDERLWETLRFLADRAAEVWAMPDRGIWEFRTDPKHFLYSKLFCWVALDRGARIADRLGERADAARWRDRAAEVRRAILEQGYDARLGAFTQVFGEPALDASALAIPGVDFLPADDPRVLGTIARIEEQLVQGGVVYRYRREDGLPGTEGAFIACSFWLVDAYAASGRIEDARALFERVTAFANDLGLLSEEVDPVRGELLGNYPQGLSHLALIRAALNIDKAEKRRERRRGRASGAERERGAARG